jgi:penicillin-binding protein-related factor A (putative recombinase)
MNPEFRTNRFNDGREFQDAIKAQLKEYQFKGIMRVKQVSPPVRLIGTGTYRRVIFLENPWLDFLGVWTRSAGRMVLIECKSTEEARLPVGGSGGVTEDQWNELQHWNNANAVAFVLWYVRSEPGCWFFTVPMLKAVLATGRKSVRPENGEAVVGKNFLANMLNHYPICRCSKCHKMMTVRETQAWLTVAGAAFCQDCCL